MSGVHVLVMAKAPVAGLVKTLKDDNVPAAATIVPFPRFRVKCHRCGKINTVEVAA